MKFADLTHQSCQWLRDGGACRDVVISSRVRLARNLAGMPFLLRCTETQQQELLQRLQQVILDAGLAAEVFYVDLAEACELDRQLLVERHLISRQHAAASYPRGVAVSTDETLSIMINEEDHLRLQVLRSGLALHEALEEANRIDDLLEQRLTYAFHDRYGYLTACPTNVGTGLRISVMLHLPALKLTGAIDKAFRAAQDMHMAIRGLYGEGTEASGDFFQLSNQVTLGVTEEQIVSELGDRVIPRVIAFEREAREALMHHQRLALEDRIVRACCLLRSARLLSSNETLYLLSLLRLGINLGMVTDVKLATVNDMFLLTQPAHLQKIHDCPMDGPQRAKSRAEYIARHLRAD